MKYLIIALILLLAACSNPETRVRPFASFEHRRSHSLEARAGVNVYTEKTKYRVYWAPMMGITDHTDQKVTLDNPLAFGFMIEGR